MSEVSSGNTNSFGYGYDDNKNLTSLTATAGTNAFAANYTYNNLDQLVSLAREKSGVSQTQAKFVYDERYDLRKSWKRHIHMPLSTIPKAG